MIDYFLKSRDYHAHKNNNKTKRIGIEIMKYSLPILLLKLNISARIYSDLNIPLLEALPSRISDQLIIYSNTGLMHCSGANIMN